MVGRVSGSEALGLEVGMRYEQKHAVTNDCNRERTVKSKVVDHPVQQDLEAESLNEGNVVPFARTASFNRRTQVLFVSDA